MATAFSRFKNQLAIATTLVGATLIGSAGGAALYVGGVGKYTGNLESSGSLKIADHSYVTGSPYCVFLDGKAKHCIYRAQLTSTGGSAVPVSPAVFSLQQTNANFGFTGTAAILGLQIWAEKPGEVLNISCGTSTGQTILNSARTNLFGGVVLPLDTGALIQKQSYGSGVVLVKNRYVQCTNSVAHEKTAGLTGEVTLEYRQID